MKFHIRIILNLPMLFNVHWFLTTDHIFKTMNELIVVHKLYKKMLASDQDPKAIIQPPVLQPIASLPLFVEAAIKPKIKHYVITDEDFAQSEDGLWATVKNLDDIPELKILYIKELNPVFNAQVEIYVNLEKTPSAINTLGVFAPDRNASKISQPKNTNQPFSLRASCNVV